MIHTCSVESNDLVTRRGSMILLILGELDKERLREEPARPHAALSLPLLNGQLDNLISQRSPLGISAKERSTSGDGKTQEGSQNLSCNCCEVCVHVHTNHTHHLSRQ